MCPMPLVLAFNIENRTNFRFLSTSDNPMVLVRRKLGYGKM